MSEVRITRARDLDENTSQSDGMVRKAAITGTMSGSSRMCASVMLAEPHSASSVHHHGEQDTIVYAAAGRSAIRSGPGGREQVELNAGDFAFIPAGLVHQELNIGDEVVMWVVTRSGPEPVVVNLERFPQS
jgi:uncharacterized RmlC-like cupin family protein